MLEWFKNSNKTDYTKLSTNDVKMIEMFNKVNKISQLSAKTNNLKQFLQTIPKKGNEAKKWVKNELLCKWTQFYSGDEVLYK